MEMSYQDHPMPTCPRCCSSNVEKRNDSTWVCLDESRTFHWLTLRAGQWVRADRWLRHTELHQGPVLEVYGEPRPLNFDSGAKLAWKLGLRYEHRSDGTTWLWVDSCSASCSCCSPA
jgi:hypothetical protein